jgi:hypothetical protein
MKKMFAFNYELSSNYSLGSALTSMNIWIGSRWCQQPKKRLLLGESWWGSEESVHRYMRRWCQGSQPDAFFTCVFNACSGVTASAATAQQKFAFWDELAFMNFVYWSVGTTNRSKATAAHFLAAQAHLELFLGILRPHVVWVLGAIQAAYSAPVIKKLGIRNVVSKHPRSGISHAKLLSDFRLL